MTSKIVNLSRYYFCEILCRGGTRVIMQFKLSTCECKSKMQLLVVHGLLAAELYIAAKHDDCVTCISPLVHSYCMQVRSEES